MSAVTRAAEIVMGATKAKAWSLTSVQREVLEALAAGAMMTAGRWCSMVGDREVAYETRTLLSRRRLITRLDQTRDADAAGNGLVISANGKAVLAAQQLKGPARTETKASRPPSDAQVAYARDLGIEVPGDATMRELSDLISWQTQNDVAPTERELAWAAHFHVDHTRYAGKQQLMGEMRMALSKPSRETDLVCWYAFCVGASQMPPIEPALAGPGDPRLRRVCAALIVADRAMQSIRRAALSEGMWSVAGPNRLPRVSPDTTAYRLASTLFRVVLTN